MTTARLVAPLLALALLAPIGARADDYAELKREAAASLNKLTAGNKAAATLRKKAKAVLVFPSMMKAGFLFGGQIGEGVLLKGGRASGIYNSVAASYGLQAGAQKFGYALFFMNDGALSYLDSSGGWEVGAGPSLVVVDDGVGKSITSTTISQDVYAFIFDQHGLMGGIGIQGSKITRIDD
jgi:lipid-binding SYLF domain-containing protein